MALIRKPFELEFNAIVKILIYGQPGIGKTTLGLSAPAPLLLDFDKGTHRVSARHQVDTVQVKSWDDVEALMLENLSPYQSLICDTAGKMLDFMTLKIMKDNPKMKKGDGTLALQGYGVRKVMFLSFLARASELGKNLVFIAHEKEEKDEEQKIIRPEMGGSSGSDLIKDLDLVGYMEAIGKKRTISFDPCEKFYGKNTCSLPARIELADLNDEKVKNDFLVTIIRQYGQMLASKKVLGDQYHHLLTDLAEAIDNLENAEQANAIVERLTKNTEHIWDTALQTSTRISAKAKALGLVFNRETKQYSDPTATTAKTGNLAGTAVVASNLAIQIAKAKEPEMVRQQDMTPAGTPEDSVNLPELEQPSIF